MKKTTSIKNWFITQLIKIKRFFVADDFLCIGCGRDVFDKKLPICDYCNSHLLYNNGRICQRCGRPLIGEGEYCGICSKKEIYFERVYSALIHEGLARKIILRYKFGNARYLADSFAILLADLVVKHNIDFDVVTYVPMTRIDEKQRGYNQTRLLAQKFCDILSLPQPLEIIKVKQTAKQEKLGYTDRATNLANAFAVNDKEDFKGKRVLIIDDVITTGATISEVARTLLKVKATSVVGITVASRREQILLD